MKRVLSVVLATVLALSLAACSNAQTQATTTPATTAAPTTTAAPETTKAPETEPAAPKVDLQILYEQDNSMINTYTLMCVNPDAPFVDADGKEVKDVALNTIGAEALINFLLSEEGEKLAAGYGYEEYGEYLFYLLDDAPVSRAEIPAATEETKQIRLSTTTSVKDSGLLGYIIPIFEEKYGYSIEVYSAGTGKSIANAKMGNADLILVHAKSQEEDFVSAGFAKKLDNMEKERMSFMYNFFVLCGPFLDPVGVKECATVKDAFKKIADEKAVFISRGDGSGTHTKELSLWPEELGIKAEPESFAKYTDWYTSANAGMGVCLTMAEEMGGYILSDKATYLTFRANGGIMQ
ncbi:MAG: substrate-binding domain-containing protein [Lachnospiraceae bacterium]|nr:substrate-binding domain-containing protein [Lachnospiraceae bacterium]